MQDLCFRFLSGGEHKTISLQPAILAGTANIKPLKTRALCLLEYTTYF
jgi:hypothetical protein